MDQAQSSNSTWYKDPTLWFPQLAYGCITVFTLWTFAGGVYTNTILRTVLSLAVVLGVAAGYVVLFKISKPKVSKELWMGLAIGAGFGLFAGAGMFWSPWTVPSPPNSIAVVVWCVLGIPAWNLVSRKLLAPSWGLKSVGFLDALTLGVAFQSAILFCVSFPAALLGSLLGRKLNSPEFHLGYAAAASLVTSLFWFWIA